jgi:hypothetical protein
MHAITTYARAFQPLRRLIVFCLALAGSGFASAADPVPVPYTALPAIQNEVFAASCIDITAKPASGIAHVAPRDATSEFLLYRPEEEQTAKVTISVNTGTVARAKPGDACPAPLSVKSFNVSIGGEPTIPPDALEKSFRVLVAAFVVALLLESEPPRLWWRPVSVSQTERVCVGFDFLDTTNLTQAQQRLLG